MSPILCFSAGGLEGNNSKNFKNLTFRQIGAKFWVIEIKRKELNLKQI